MYAFRLGLGMGPAVAQASGLGFRDEECESGLEGVPKLVVHVRRMQRFKMREDDEREETGRRGDDEHRVGHGSFHRLEAVKTTVQLQTLLLLQYLQIERHPRQLMFAMSYER